MNYRKNSTCHWCHVMAHESFEDREVAAALNQDYISIKVDREERPDIDAVYMKVCQMLTDSGGWPMTIIMTPEQRPFYAGTYLPKHSRPGMIGLMEVLAFIANEWKENRENLLQRGEQITGHLNQEKPEELSELSTDLLQKGRDLFERTYDEQWGGFGGAPKFPTPHNLLFLLSYGTQNEDDEALNMAEETLRKIFRGGIFDHIGGGISRYSTDEKWLVPHFEKMLYDNALLSFTFLHANLLTGTSFYAGAAQKILDYVLRELTHENGGFYCGQDADSEGIEGKFYVFTPGEIKEVLGETKGEQFCRQFHITEEGNFEGKSIPNLIEEPEGTEDQIAFQAMEESLYQYRILRTQLHLDDKILTSWNGLMIAALAKASCLKEGMGYLDAAQRAQQFIERYLTDRDGRLLVRWRNGKADHKGQLDDYAFYGLALIELYQVTFEIRYLSRAIKIAEHMEEYFWDQDGGGFYLYAADSEQLITRPKEVYDGAMPSGNSVAAYVLGRLARLTGDVKLQHLWDRQAAFLSARVKGYPAGYGFALVSFMEILYPSVEIICTTPKSSAPQELLDFVKENILFNTTVIVKHQENQEELLKVAQDTKEYPIAEEDHYYLCRNHTCSLPMTLKELKDELQ